MVISLLKLALAAVFIGILNAEPQAKFYPAEEKDASDRYIVVLRKGVNQALEIVSLSLRLKETFGIQSERQIHIGDFRALIVKTDRERVRGLLNEAEIDYIEQDKPVKAFENSSSCLDYPIDEFGQWGLVRLDSRTAIRLECGSYLCNYTDYNTYSYSDLDNGTDTYVYVFDTGIRVGHDDFGGRAEHGFVASTVQEPPGDSDGHGTHVAGISVGERSGVAKAATAISVKVLNGTGQGSFSGIVEGVEWVVNDVKTKQRKGVCNLSLGGLGRSSAMEDAIRSAMAEGVPFVIAAGNDGHEACYETPAYLGKDTAAITVGATTATDDLAFFSNFGECVTILAPGFYITSAGISNDTDYVAKMGTSMAAPFVAGVVARLMSREQSPLTPWGIKLWLLEMATGDAITMRTLPKLLHTPNKLLYFNCNLPYVELTTPATTPPEVCGSDSSIWGYGIKTRMLNVIMLALMVAVFLQT